MGMEPDSAFCFSTKSSPSAPATFRLKKTFKSGSSVFTNMEYSGPNSSILKRNPSPTKHHDVVVSTMSLFPSSSKYSMRDRAKSSDGFLE